MIPLLIAVGFLLGGSRGGVSGTSLPPLDPKPVEVVKTRILRKGEAFATEYEERLIAPTSILKDFDPTKIGIPPRSEFDLPTQDLGPRIIRRRVLRRGEAFATERDERLIAPLGRIVPLSLQFVR